MKIPKGQTKKDRERIADAIIEYIVDRTRNRSLKNNGQPFPKYSDEYRGSLDFKIAGKTKKVDLTLSGDMLAAIDIVRHDKKEIVIGFKPDDPEVGRAEGNARAVAMRAVPH